MKKTFKPTSALTSLLACLCLITAAGYAISQPPPDTPPKPVPVDDDEPAVTNLDKPEVRQTTQTIQQGEQTEVIVTNSLGTYVVKPNERVGTSLPGDGQSNSNNPVQWVIKSWGGDKNTTKDDAPPPTLQSDPDAPESR